MELQHKDRSFAGDTTNLFFKLHIKTIQQITNAVSVINIRKRKGVTRTAKEVGDKKLVNDLISRDDGYKSCLASVVNFPAYFDNEKNKLLAMIRQLGQPTLYLTLSPCERDWSELHCILKEAKLNCSLTEEEKQNIFNLKINDRQKIRNLICNDPVTCARYFNHQFLAMFRFINSQVGIFSRHKITDSYYRVEYQQRGSPHVHMLLWMDGAPLLDLHDTTSFQKCIEFIDKYILASSSHEYASYHRHRHTFTCWKKKR